MSTQLLPEPELQSLIDLGQALWLDPRERELALTETLAAASLAGAARGRLVPSHDDSPGPLVERTASALLGRVLSRGGAANFRSNIDAGVGIGSTFFSLAPEERFLLIALHLEHWSYARIARVFGESARAPEEGARAVEIAAWRARLRFLAMTPGLPYPTGAPARGLSCPEYDSARPWTQRFLDDEITSGRERLFLQNHLLACEACRGALRRCREAYYALEGALPARAADARLLTALARASRQSVGIRTPTQRTFVETLAIFIRRREIALVLLAFSLFLVWMGVSK